MNKYKNLLISVIGLVPSFIIYYVLRFADVKVGYLFWVGIATYILINVFMHFASYYDYDFIKIILVFYIIFCFILSLFFSKSILDMGKNSLDQAMERKRMTESLVANSVMQDIKEYLDIYKINIECENNICIRKEGSSYYKINCENPINKSLEIDCEMLRDMNVKLNLYTSEDNYCAYIKLSDTEYYCISNEEEFKDKVIRTEKIPAKCNSPFYSCK